MRDEGVKMEGKLFNIQRFSTGDGPGIRTTVFFKGCPLKCKWCHNPESQAMYPQIGYYKEKCLHCGKCAVVCPRSAIKFEIEKNEIDHHLCDLCGECVKACTANAVEKLGRIYSVEEVMKQIMRDYSYYGKTGGVTLSGGEPTLQSEFAQELLKKIKEENCHTALDTCGYCNWESLQKLLPYVDLVLYDLKHMNSDKHKEMTGVDNEMILDNFRRIQKAGIRTRVRVPMIPGFNDTDENLERLAAFLKPYPSVEVELLGYHAYGISKYEAIGKSYELKGCIQPSKEQMESYRKWLGQFGIKCVGR